MADKQQIDPTVIFVFLGIIAIIIYGFIQLFTGAHEFSIKDFGESFGFVLGGGGIHAIGAGVNNHLTPENGP